MRLFSFLVFIRSVDSGVLVRRAYLNKKFAQMFILQLTAFVLFNSLSLNLYYVMFQIVHTTLNVGVDTKVTKKQVQ